MVNDRNTLNGALTELGETMATNLVSMGVTGADASDGLTTLAGKILDIEPSIGGLDLDTAITLSASSTSIISGQSVVFTSKLTASYDDETVTDVDLTGVLTGATVLFEDLNGVVVGSGVTDSTGYATATVSNLAAGSHTIKAIFEGTDNFHYADSSTVTITVTAQSFDGITISNTNDVISYNNGSSPESTTITAQLTDSGSAVSVSGETVTFNVKKGDTVIETLSDTTDNTGSASVTYTAHGVGDCTVTVECNLLTETYATTLQDCLVYDSLTSASGKWTIPSAVSSTYDSNGWKSNASAYSQVKLTEKLTGACSVEFTLTGYDTTSNPCVIIYQYTNGETTPNQAILMGASTNSSNRKVFNTPLDHDLIVGGVYRIEYTSSTVKVYENGTLLGSASNSVGFPTRFEFHTGTNRYAIYKDLKVKPL